MPRPGVGDCFCRKTEANSRLASCRSAAEQGLGGDARESICPRRERQCEKAARACFEHQNLRATGVTEAGSQAAGKCERQYDEGGEQIVARFLPPSLGVTKTSLRPSARNILGQFWRPKPSAVATWTARRPGHRVGRRRERQGRTTGPVAGVGRSPDITDGAKSAQPSRNAGPGVARGAGDVPAISPVVFSFPFPIFPIEAP
jgi:hypothetical protein